MTTDADDDAAGDDACRRAARSWRAATTAGAETAALSTVLAPSSSFNTRQRGAPQPSSSPAAAPAVSRTMVVTVDKHDVIEMQSMSGDVSPTAAV